jgi:hypothetical protein
VINKIEPRAFIIPMCEFPSFYNEDYYKVDYFNMCERKCSIFMAGNMDPRYYSKISTRSIFKIQSRLDTAEFLFTKSYFKNISNFTDLLKFIEGDEDNKLILIDTHRNFRINGVNLKIINSKFEYYLALPGIDMPLSHNLIEAISSGCIPVLHKEYANLFYPPLEDQVHAFLYETLDELDVILLHLKDYSLRKRTYLRENLREYFVKNLSPESIVNKIESECFEKIYLLAENDSLNLLKIK